MSNTLENLQRRKESAAELESVVRTMKAMAASNITQYEMAVQALQDFYWTVSLALKSCLGNPVLNHSSHKNTPQKKQGKVIAIVFGSDQGLVGRFNDAMAGFVQQSLKDIQQETETWAIGERVHTRLADAGLHMAKLFALPNSVKAITQVVNDILINAEESREQQGFVALYVYHHAPAAEGGYQPVVQKLLPFDDKWKDEFLRIDWPTKNPPQIIGGVRKVLPRLVSEYLFVSLFKACAESLASENASRLAAMTRAEKNIGEMQEQLNQTYNRLRQSNIDEELFDVIAGFEALK